MPVRFQFREQRRKGGGAKIRFVPLLQTVICAKNPASQFTVLLGKLAVQFRFDESHGCGQVGAVEGSVLALPEFCKQLPVVAGKLAGNGLKLLRWRGGASGTDEEGDVRQRISSLIRLLGGGVSWLEAQKRCGGLRNSCGGICAGFQQHRCNGDRTQRIGTQDLPSIVPKILHQEEPRNRRRSQQRKPAGTRLQTTFALSPQLRLEMGSELNHIYGCRRLCGLLHLVAFPEFKGQC